jgi:hypothetical protein
MECEVSRRKAKDATQEALTPLIHPMSNQGYGGSVHLATMRKYVCSDQKNHHANQINTFAHFRIGKPPFHGSRH